jgi:ABC-type bacteriocin/lantibiotic exporter with double-glycine peptidase domain
MIFVLFRTFKPAIETSIIESNEKYQIFDVISEGAPISNEHIHSYLQARDNHFYFTKMNAIKVSTITIISQMLLLGFGSYLIQINQLSVGQLVSAEIIVSGIFISLLKLPQTLESVFDYETSQYKIAKAIKEK